MLFIVLTASALTCFELYNISRQAGPKVFKTLLGYSWIPEITCSIILPAIAMTTGSLTSILISIVAGFFFTLTLEVCKRIIGTRKLKKVNGKRQWVETEGQSFASFVRGLGTSMFNKVKKFATDVAKPTTIA